MAPASSTTCAVRQAISENVVTANTGKPVRRSQCMSQSETVADSSSIAVTASDSACRAPRKASANGNGRRTHRLPLFSVMPQRAGNLSKALKNSPPPPHPHCVTGTIHDLHRSEGPVLDRIAKVNQQGGIANESRVNYLAILMCQV